MNRWLRELKPGTFLALIIIAIVVGRLGLILITPGLDQNIDLSIYREVGELVVNGVDPYDFSSQSGEFNIRYQPDAVVHLAAESHVDRSIFRPGHVCKDKRPGHPYSFGSGAKLPEFSSPEKFGRVDFTN